MPFQLSSNWICESCFYDTHEECVDYEKNWDGRPCECLCTGGLET